MGERQKEPRQAKFIIENGKFVPEGEAGKLSEDQLVKLESGLPFTDKETEEAIAIQEREEQEDTRDDYPIDWVTEKWG